MNEIAPTTDSSTLPGYVLSRWRIIDYAEAEREFRDSFLRETYLASSVLPDVPRREAIRGAHEYVAEGNLDYGAKGFKLRLFSASALPFMLWLSLRKEMPEISREKAAQLITEANESPIKQSILVLIGLGGQQPKKDQPTNLPSSGSPSTAPSENAD